MAVSSTRDLELQSPTRFPAKVVLMQHRPALARVPAAPVPRRQQCYANATTPCTASVRITSSPADSRPIPRRLWRTRTLCYRRWSVFRRLRVDCTGIPRLPNEPSRGYAEVLRSRPIRRRLACSGTGAAVAERTTKGSSTETSRLDSVASRPAVYASRRALP